MCPDVVSIALVVSLKNLAFRTNKILFWSFGNYRDWLFCGDAQAICEDFTLFQFLHFCDPDDIFFLFYLFTYSFLLSKTTIIDILSVVWLQMKRRHSVDQC